jgi:hypothetical protein
MTGPGSLRAYSSDDRILAKSADSEIGAVWRVDPQVITIDAWASEDMENEQPRKAPASGRRHADYSVTVQHPAEIPPL